VYWARCVRWMKERGCCRTRKRCIKVRRCGADLIAYFAPHEGSSTLAYGIYNIPSLAAYETYRTRLAADPLGRENYAFAQSENFLLREDRTFLKCVSHTQGEPK